MTTPPLELAARLEDLAHCWTLSDESAADVQAAADYIRKREGETTALRASVPTELDADGADDIQPQRGSITASCGHVLTDGDEGREVRYSGETCDAVEGFKPCVHYAWFCTACADEARSWPEFLPDEAAAEAFFTTPDTEKGGG